MKRLPHLLLLLALFQTGLPVARAQSDATALAIQNSAGARLNLVTNKVYTGNEMVPYLLEIDGATNELQKIPLERIPGQIVVNPATNKIYVDLYWTRTIDVIDGATNEVSKVTLPGIPDDMAVDPLRNKIYAADASGGRVIVIDGATNQTSTIPVGLHPVSVAINPRTNKIYLGNYWNKVFTILDLNTKKITRVQIAGGSDGQTICVNSVTNKIYVAATDERRTVTVIDGATDKTTGVLTAGYVSDLALNPVTNKIYATNIYIGKLTVIDGATNQTSTTQIGHFPTTLAVNTATNKIYIGNSELCGSVTVVDGTTGNISGRISAGRDWLHVMVNPLTNKIYVDDPESVTVIDGDTNRTTQVPLPITPGVTRSSGCEVTHR